MRWGLVPSWATEIKGPLMINARMETVTEKPAYRRLIPRGERRALQIADGYYEWLKPEHRASRASRSTSRSTAACRSPSPRCGHPRRSKAGWLHSITLLTCDSAPNRVAAAIHDRMPVILADEDAQRAWLDPSLGAEEALALCGALPASAAHRPPGEPGRQQRAHGCRGAGAARGARVASSLGSRGVRGQAGIGWGGALAADEKVLRHRSPASCGDAGSLAQSGWRSGGRFFPARSPRRGKALLARQPPPRVLDEDRVEDRVVHHAHARAAPARPRRRPASSTSCGSRPGSRTPRRPRAGTSRSWRRSPGRSISRSAWPRRSSSAAVALRLSIGRYISRP